MNSEYSFFLNAVSGLVKVFAHPLFYVALLLVGLQYSRQNAMERRMFGVRVSSWRDQFVRSMLFGAAGGLVATLLMAGLQVALSPNDLLYVWVVALVLALVNARFICFAYAGGLLSAVSLALQAMPEMSFGASWLQTIYLDLRGLQVAPLMALVAILHLVEALLVRWNGAAQPLPVFVESKRGRLIGGFILQKFWVLPMAAIVATGTGGSSQMAAFPAVLGYSGVALTQFPEQKAKSMSNYLLAYSIGLLALAIGSEYWPWLLWAAALFCIGVHELLILLEIRREQGGQPQFVRPLQGLKILTVLPGSPAAEMGLLPGETIVRVNGTPVNTPYDLHFAINQNPAFAKLEVLTADGEPKFSARPIYMGDHHQLGIILVPDDQARQYVRLDTISPWRWLWGRLVGGQKQGPSTYH